MDLTATAQALQGALALAQQPGFSPITLIAMAAPVVAHSAPALLAKVPDVLKPAAQDAGVVLTTAAVSMMAGSDWKTALGYGVAQAGAGRIYHFIALHPSGPMSILAGILKGIVPTKPVEAPKVQP